MDGVTVGLGVTAGFFIFANIAAASYWGGNIKGAIKNISNELQAKMKNDDQKFKGLFDEQKKTNDQMGEVVNHLTKINGHLEQQQQRQDSLEQSFENCSSEHRQTVRDIYERMNTIADTHKNPE